MDALQKVLSGIDGGRVLDVATGSGVFAGVLADHLGSFEHITGVDTTEAAVRKARESFTDERFSFVVGDAAALPFDDESFDTVSMANSLHHMEHLDDVLKDMLRVLRPGGKLVVFEMYRDGQNDAQQVHVDLHHWWAAIDSARGIHHRETYTRADLETLLERLPLTDLLIEDYVDEDADPHEGETVTRIEEAIDAYIERADDLGDAASEDMSALGEVLRERLHDVGFQGATHVIAVGTK
jgi:ubiquinone/menaquinone biosynthesis C-methylase UbiE